MLRVISKSLDGLQMAIKAKYKVGDIVEFNWAGSTESGEILEVRKSTSTVEYSIDDKAYKYPVDQKNIIKKL